MIAGHYEFYPVEAYGGTPGPSQGFRYLPAIAFLFVPFGWLPLEVAALAFFALKLAAVWYVGATVARHAGLSEGRWQVFVIAFLIVGGYIVEELRFGNVHFLIVALMVFAYDRAEAGSVLLPAAALAVAIAIKLTPVALLGYLAFRRRGAVCLVTVAILAFLIVAPAAVMGSAANARELRAYATYAAEKIDEDVTTMRFAVCSCGTSRPAMRMSLMSKRASPIFRPRWSMASGWSASLGLGLAALAAVWREDDDPVVRLLEFSIVLTGIVLASPHTQRRYFVALYVPAVALVALLAAPAGAARQALDSDRAAGHRRAGHDSAASLRRATTGAALRGRLPVFLWHGAPVRRARHDDDASKGRRRDTDVRRAAFPRTRPDVSERPPTDWRFPKALLLSGR